jgi:hypothetical protein
MPAHDEEAAEGAEPEHDEDAAEGAEPERGAEAPALADAVSDAAAEDADAGGDGYGGAAAEVAFGDAAELAFGSSAEPVFGAEGAANAEDAGYIGPERGAGAPAPADAVSDAAAEGAADAATEGADASAPPQFGEQGGIAASEISGGRVLAAQAAKNMVDSAQNIDKMGSVGDSVPQNVGISDIELVGMAFERLNSGELEKSAEYFYAALGRHPARELEFRIVIMLCHIYMDFGNTELSLDILKNYRDKYGHIMAKSDLAEIESCILGITEAGQ